MTEFKCFMEEQIVINEVVQADQKYNPESENAQSGKAVAEAVNTKQNTLISGTNIKTINNESILGEGNIEIETAQPDWNQNDPTAPDYVKNRTHYAEESIVGITFDGNLGGRVVVDAYDGDFKIVKVSDDLPSAEDLIGQTVTFTYQDGSTVEYTLEEENISIDVHNLWITHVIDRVVYPSLFIVNSSEEAANDIGGNPEDIPLGTYFAYAVDNYGYYISSCASVTRNIKKIDEKFLPELALIAKTGDYKDLLNKPTIDQTYKSESENAQSGKALKQAIDTCIPRVKGDPAVYRGYLTAYINSDGTPSNFEWYSHENHFHEITIGNTTLTEYELQQLLELIS